MGAEGQRSKLFVQGVWGTGLSLSICTAPGAARKEPSQDAPGDSARSYSLNLAWSEGPRSLHMKATPHCEHERRTPQRSFMQVFRFLDTILGN